MDDAILVVQAPGARPPAQFHCHVVRGSRKATLDSVKDLMRWSRLPILLIADHLSPAWRLDLEALGVSYVDASGWVRLVDDWSGLLVVHQGAPRTPRVGVTTTTTTVTSERIQRLGGSGASRVIETLFSVALPVGVRDLAIRAEVSPGTVAKILPTLVRAGAVERGASGNVVQVDRRALMDRWTEDYSFLDSNKTVVPWLAPRGLEWFVQQAAALAGEQDMQLVATGSWAARQLLPEGVLSVAPLAAFHGYCTDRTAMRDLVTALRLVPPTVGRGNVTLAVPADPGLLGRRRPGAPLQLAPLARVVADLRSLGGRFEDEADQLLGASGGLDISSGGAR
ncbi:MAG: hypothetical protein L0G49_09025 [Luteococcus sp.]|uniref:hypothetical protein n=1 Tax=Luteococcus sp. TaxID=1969402 RepID=UPI002648C1A8|nr:hypothetical protein [Luteococcus sp.]MDN5563893.1 hypothetical protein [Luteococcus sp.]